MKSLAYRCCDVKKLVIGVVYEFLDTVIDNETCAHFVVSRTLSGSGNFFVFSPHHFVLKKDSRQAGMTDNRGYGRNKKNLIDFDKFFYGGVVMDLWEKVKRDVQKGVKEGIAAIREKAEELSEEGKKRIRLFDLKTKIQAEFTELGGKVYSSSTKMKNPMLDGKVKAITNRIKKLEAQIAKLEGKQKTTTKKKAAKK